MYPFISDGGFKILMVLVLGIASQSRGALLVTSSPVGMRKPTDAITIAWTGGTNRIHLRASTIPGGNQGQYDSLHLPSQLSDGSYTFRINTDIPAAYRSTDLRIGVNYCILSDGSLRSPEFMLLIESNQAPIAKSPANAAVLQDAAPIFSWSGQAPFYTLLVSDEPFKISDSGTVAGISATWQILTPYTTARYGEPDPSGLIGIQAPPLVSGKTYNWLVLNNYTGTSAGTSKVASTPQSFTYVPTTSIEIPILASPRDEDTLNAPDIIDFAWNPVANSVSYKLELLEENQIAGSQADLVVWKVSVTGEKARLSGASSLLRRYRYKWRVYALNGDGAASVSVKRTFFYAISVATFQAKLQSTSGKAIAYAAVRVSRIGAAASSVYQSGSTDDGGVLELQKAPLGTYEVRCENIPGYLAQTDTIRHTGPGTTQVTVALTPSLGRILGRITAPIGNGLLAATIQATLTDGVVTTAKTNSQGDYQLSLPLGSYTLTVNADGYAMGTSRLTLGQATPESRVDMILIPKPFTLTVAVINAYSQKTLLGAKVNLSQQGQNFEKYSDGQGLVRFAVNGGDIVLTAGAPGFAAAKPTTLSVNTDRNLTLALDPGASLVSGRVRNPQNTSIAQALIRAIPSKGLVMTALSDGQGYYELNLGAGDWVIEASKSGYSATNRLGFTLESGRTLQDMDLGLQPNPSFALGRITLQGKGLADVSVTSNAATAMTDGGGYFRISLPAGSHSLTAQKTGYLFSSPISIYLGTSDSATGLIFTASANAGGISGSVRSSGFVVAEAYVVALGSSNERVTGKTSLEGTYSFALQPGSYRIWSDKNGFQAADTLNVQITSGSQSNGLVLNLNSFGGRVQGQIRSGTLGLGGCGLSYAASPNGTPNGVTQSDGNGFYGVTLNPGLAYKITANCDGYQSLTQSLVAISAGEERYLQFDMSLALASFSGKVMGPSNQPLVGAQISLYSGTQSVLTIADIDGRYKLNLGSGIWSMGISKTGYSTRNRTINIPGVNPISFLDTLTAVQGRLSAVVTDGKVGIANSTILLLSNDGGYSRTLKTDGEGRADFGAISAGSYKVTADKNGYSGQSVTTNLAADQVAQVSIVLGVASATVSGRVTLQGSGFSNATVSISSAGFSRFSVSRSDGSFVLDSLPEGLYRLQAYATGYASETGIDSLRLGVGDKPSGLSLSVTYLSASLQGRLLGADNPSGFRLQLKGSKGYTQSIEADAQGKFQFASLPEDKYILASGTPGWRVLGDLGTSGIVLNKATTLDVSVSTASYSISGTLLDQGGKAMVGAPVMARTSDWQAQVSTDAQGNFRMNAVPSGVAILVGCVSQSRIRFCSDTSLPASIPVESKITLKLFGSDRRGILSGVLELAGKPLPNALVRITGLGNETSVYSSSDGSWRFEGLAFGGKLHLIIEATGGNRIDTVLAPEVGASVSGVQINLKPARVKVSLRLLNTLDKPISSAPIAFTNASLSDTVFTDAQGLTSFNNLPSYSPLSVSVLLNSADYDVASLSLRVGETDTAIDLKTMAHRSKITVLLVDEKGKAVSDASVWRNGLLQGLSANGSFQCLHVPAGFHRITVSKNGYQGSESEILKTDGDTSIAASLALQSLSEGITGIVYDTVVNAVGKLMQRPLVGVELQASFGNQKQSVRTDASGRFIIQAATASSVKLTLSLPGHYSWTKTIDYASGLTTQDIFLPAQTGTVSGRILGAEQAVVTAMGAAEEKRFVNSVGRDGWFALTGMTQNTPYFLSVRTQLDSSLGVPSFSFQGRSDVAQGYDATLLPFGRMLITVTEFTSRQPLSGVRVWLLQNGQKTDAGSTSSLGMVDFRGLNTGVYSVIGSAPGFKSDTVTSLTLSSAQDLIHAGLRLQAEQSFISGQITDNHGNGLAGTVELKRQGGSSLISKCGISGNFRFLAPSAGRYSLRATYPGFHEKTSEEFDYSGMGGWLERVELGYSRDTLWVQAIDAITLKPISGLKLNWITSISNDSVITDSMGNSALKWAGESIGSLSSNALDYQPLRGLVFRQDSAALPGMISLVFVPDYRFDGSIQVTIRDRNLPVLGAVIEVAPLAGNDKAILSVTGEASNLFPGLRLPAEYRISVRRAGFTDLIQFISITRLDKTPQIHMTYPSSRLRIQVTEDGFKPTTAGVSMDGISLFESDTMGLYTHSNRFAASTHLVQITGGEAMKLVPDAYSVALGDDTVRTDTVALVFVAEALKDTVLESDIPLRVKRSDSLEYSETDVCSLFVRPLGGIWKGVGLKTGRKDFTGIWNPSGSEGKYEAYFQVIKTNGVKIGIESGGRYSHLKESLSYSNRNSPMLFRLRDPRILNAIRFFPASAEGDTMRYDLNSRDRFEIQLLGEAGLNLNAFVDRFVKNPDTARPLAISWRFLDSIQARRFGLTLSVSDTLPRFAQFKAGTKATDAPIGVEVSVKLGTITLRTISYLRVEDLRPVALGISYPKDGLDLATVGTPLGFSNHGDDGYHFEAFGLTADGKRFRIRPRWSLGTDSAAGFLNQEGVFTPAKGVARQASLYIYDTLETEKGLTPFSTMGLIKTEAFLAPADTGVVHLSDGDGLDLAFPLGGLTKSFKISVSRPLVNPLLRASPNEEVVGAVHEIELSESQPFKPDSGARLRLPISSGNARLHKVYVGHWNSSLLKWERIDSATADSQVYARVSSFSKYAVVMGSLPLGAYGFETVPNPFSPLDPWALQLHYTLSSEISSQVGVRVEVFNMVGDKVYSSREVLISKGQEIKPGQYKAGPNSADRRDALGPYVWDGRDDKGALCRNGRYLLRLLVRDGQKSKEYLRKVVLIQ